MRRLDLNKPVMRNKVLTYNNNEQLVQLFEAS
jgi:hypothetical protein